MAVQQDRIDAARARRRRLEEDHRRAAGKPHDLDPQPLHRLPLGPLRGVDDDALDVAVLRPVGIERGAFRGHRDVVGQRMQDLVVPFAFDEIGEAVVVDGGSDGGGHGTEQTNGLTDVKWR